MKITKEHIKIIECFFYDNYSFKEVSMILGIPEYKIRRNLNEVYVYYNVKNLDELKIKLKSNWKAQLKLSLEINKLDRINYILLNFLKNDFLNLNKLALVLGISRRMLSKDLDEIKLFLSSYNLIYVSLNSKGIQLTGTEEDKKAMFKTLLFNLFIDRNYLPNIFDSIFNDFNKVIDEKIQSIIRNKLLKENVIMHTYIILYIEIILFIGIIRNNYSLNFYKLKFEVKNILELCKKNKNQVVLYTYLNEFNDVKDFIQFLKKYLMISLSLPEEVYISLVTRFKLIEEKNKLNLKEFYLLNRTFINNFEKHYNEFIKVIEKYFKTTSKKIDSLDKISFYLILKNYLYFDKEESINTIIVYDTFQLLILNNVIKELKEQNIKVEKAVSVYSLKSYLKNNPVKNILIFENINFKNFVKLNKNINILKISLPILDNTYLEIKKNLKN